MLRILAVMASVLALSGCATWVNIPAQRGDMAVHNPNEGNVRDVMIAAITRAVTDDQTSGAYAVQLPSGTYDYAYRRVIASLPSGAVRLTPEAAGLPIYRVKQVQIRGFSGQVDLIPPPRGGSAQLLTVYLKRDLSGWYAKRTHLWRMPVVNALRISRPMTPPGMAPVPHRDFDEKSGDDASPSGPASSAEASPTPEPQPAPAEPDELENPNDMSATDMR